MVRSISQPFCLMIGVQALCLSIGFWFQYQLTISTTEHDTNESVWSELETSSRPIASTTMPLQAHRLTAGSPELKQAQAVLDSGPLADHSCLLLTDADGKLLCLSATATSQHWVVGDPVTWRSDRESRTPDAP